MLRLTLAVNTDTIADYEVRNVCPASTHDDGEHACRYEVRKIIHGPIHRGLYTEGPPLLEIHHIRQAGAHELARAVLARLS